MIEMALFSLYVNAACEKLGLERKLKSIEEIVCRKRASYFDTLTPEQKASTDFMESEHGNRLLHLAIDKRRDLDLSGIPRYGRVLQVPEDLWEIMKLYKVVSDDGKMIPMVMGFRLEREK